MSGYKRGAEQAREIAPGRYVTWRMLTAKAESLRLQLKLIEEHRAEAAGELGRAIAGRFGVRIGSRVTRGRGRPGVVTDIIWKPSHSVVVLIVKLDDVNTQRSLPLDARGSEGHHGWELDQEVPSP